MGRLFLSCWLLMTITAFGIFQVTTNSNEEITPNIRAAALATFAAISAPISFALVRSEKNEES